jgi:hypothetical protein
MTDNTFPSIFINYRTSDEPLAAALLDSELSARFGADSVFLDHRSLGAGTPFAAALRTAVRHCDVLLVVIGPRWLGATDEHGRRLIDQRGDWVRTEIAEAYQAGAAVVPVLVGDVARLSRAALPPSIRALAGNQYLRLRPRERRADLDQLIAELRRLVPRFTDPSDGDPSAA